MWKNHPELHAAARQLFSLSPAAVRYLRGAPNSPLSAILPLPTEKALEETMLPLNLAFGPDERNTLAFLFIAKSANLKSVVETRQVGPYAHSQSLCMRWH